MTTGGEGLKPCACGCGEMVMSKWKRGHARRASTTPLDPPLTIADFGEPMFSELPYEPFPSPPPPPPPPPRPCRIHKKKRWFVGRLQIIWTTTDVCMLERGHDGPHVPGWPRMFT